MKYLYNPATGALDDTTDKDYLKKAAAGTPIKKVGGFDYYDTAAGIDHFTKTLLEDDNTDSVKKKSDLFNLNTQMKEAVIERESKYFKENQFDSFNPETYPSNPTTRGRLLNLSELEDNIIADPATRVTRGRARYADGGIVNKDNIDKLSKVYDQQDEKLFENLPILNQGINAPKKDKPKRRDTFQELVRGELKIEDVTPTPKGHKSDWDIIYSAMTPQEKGTWNAEQRKKATFVKALYV